MSRFMKAGAILLIAASTAGAQRAPVKLPPRPEAAPPKPLVYPTVTFDSLPNGLRFAIVENHELPLVVVQTIVPGAGPQSVSFLDTPAKAGAWGLMLTTLREGTTLRSSTQISDEVADLGTDMRFTSTTAFSPPAFRAARSTWKASLDLLADVLINPAFPEAGVTRLQTALVGAMDRLAPATVANRILYNSLYGAESPNSAFATAASLRSVTRDDVIALHQKYLRPQNFMMVVAGDVSVAEARAAVAKSFGGWQRGGTTVTPIVPAAPATPSPTTIYLKDSPGLAQALIVAGQILPGRDNADAAAIETLASVLGDFSVSAGSRVYNAFRIDRGLSYSARVELMSRPVPETVPLIATLAVAPTVTDTAINVLLGVFRELRQGKPATASELDFSKRNLIGRLPGDLERLDVLATTVALTMRDRLPADYMNRWIGRINAATLADIQAAASRYLDPDHMAIVVIADRSKVETALRASGIPVVLIP
jgi:zinc protease